MNHPWLFIKSTFGCSVTKYGRNGSVINDAWGDQSDVGSCGALLL
jgi:hypothetical protein